MPDYVYAQHEFVPEHDDELSFKAGERIEIVERDDQYGDGWWQGRTADGKIGLFPGSYTGIIPPAGLGAAHQTLQPLKEEPEPPSGETETSGDGAVMQATMTDVQQAIEQLGVNRDTDGHSISQISSRTGNDTDRETDRELDTEEEGEGWHKNIRQRLAENARLETERRAAKEAAQQDARRNLAPPIDVEMSDESEVEDDIPEEEENSLLRPVPGGSGPPASRSEQDLRTARAAEFDLPASSSPRIPSPSPAGPRDPASARGSPQPRGTRLSLPTPVSPTALASPARAASPTSVQPSTPVPQPKATFNGTTLEAAAATPIPTTISGPNTALPSPAASSEPRARLSSTATSSNGALGRNATEWNVAQVGEWLRSKGFEDGIVDKFAEHEISGDVLLELDANLLKELDIPAFGKRMRIAHAIADLKRPPSVISDRGPSQSLHHPSSSFSPSVGSSAPGGYMFESPPNSGDYNNSPGFQMDPRRESDPYPQYAERNGLGFNMPHSAPPNGDSISKGKHKPAHLTLSSSDMTLSRGQHIPEERESDVGEDRAVMSETEASKGGMRRRLFGLSTDSAGSSRQQTKDSSSRTSKEVSTPISSIPPSPPTKRESLDDSSTTYSRHSRQKRSVDTGRSSDRLSFFGNTFGGKSRKPAPRLSAFVPEEPQEKRSLSGRLHIGSTSTKKPGRPSTAQSVKGEFGKGEFGKGEFGQRTPEKPREAKSFRDLKDTPSPAGKDPAVLRRRATSSPPTDLGAQSPNGDVTLKPGQSVLQQIGESDYNGWLRKKSEGLNSWKLRYFVLKGPHLYSIRSNSTSETKIKGYVNVTGYRVIADENVNPGKYGFRIIHEKDKTHFFSSDEQLVVREWMKAMMKATIGRDFSRPVLSSANINTIPLSVAQAMNPAPRPPSPSQREATQRLNRRENPNQLSSRDARVLMGLPSSETYVDTPQSDSGYQQSFYQIEEGHDDSHPPVSRKTSNPPGRPSREMRRPTVSQDNNIIEVDEDLIDWADSHLPPALSVRHSFNTTYGGLALLRIAEHIKGRPSEPPVPDSAFPVGQEDDKLEGYFKLFDFLLENDVRVGSVSINDVRQGNTEKIVQLLRALRSWEDKRRNIARNIGGSSMQAGPWMAIMPRT